MGRASDGGRDVRGRGDGSTGSGGHQPLSTEDVFPGVAGGRRGGCASAEDANALGAEKATQREVRAVEAMDSVSDRAVRLEVERGAAEVTCGQVGVCAVAKIAQRGDRFRARGAGASAGVTEARW